MALLSEEQDKSVDISDIKDNDDFRIKIKQLLSDCFGEEKTSKAIGYERKTSKKYFFALDDEKEILRFVDILNKNLTKEEIKIFKEKRELYTLDSKIEKEKLPLCACYYEKEDNTYINYGKKEFVIDFYFIQGVSYHRTNNKKIGASIIIKSTQYLTLDTSKKDTFFGIFNDAKNEYYKQQIEGIFYRVNKMTFLYDNFKSFISKLFIFVGVKTNRYILKDIGNTIMKDGFFLLEISYDQLNNCRVPKDIIKQFVDEKDSFNINYNKIDLNVSYLLIKLSKYVLKRDWSKLLEMTPDTIHHIANYSILFNGLNNIGSQIQLLENYYINKFRDIDFFSNGIIELDYYSIIKDYIKQSIELEEKVSLCLSLQQLMRKHDNITSKYLKKSIVRDIDLVKKPSKFDVLDDEFKEIDNFKRITTDTELYAEGEKQSNCVFSRKYLIETDQVAIYHWDYKDESITMQINSNDNHFWIDEMRGRFNIQCSNDAQKRIINILNTINNVLAGFRSIL